VTTDLTPQPPSRRWKGEPGERPISESLKRHAIRPTSPQSDALARLLAEGRRLCELFALGNGTLGATFAGLGFAAWRAFITLDGRVQENESASEPDPDGSVAGPLIIARDEERLHLGTLLPARRARPPLPTSPPRGGGEENGSDAS
jgi:hypothetical protein